MSDLWNILCFQTCYYVNIVKLTQLISTIIWSWGNIPPSADIICNWPDVRSNSARVPKVINGRIHEMRREEEKEKPEKSSNEVIEEKLLY